ncbi:MAG: hypothetical protein RBR68_11270 [Tenuifilaceae bacterium]|nr:hypothetical protein [Tenuifilaceae bacterium]
MKFENVEETKQIIEEASKYINENDITIEDIKRSTVFKSKSNNMIIIPLQIEYIKGHGQYILLGNCNNVNMTYSDKPQSAIDIIKWLKDMDYKKTNMKLGIVEFTYD